MLNHMFSHAISYNLTHLWRITRRDTDSINDTAQILKGKLTDVLVDVSLHTIFQLGRLDGTIAVRVPQVE